VSHRSVIYLRVLGIIALVTVGFLVLKNPFREFEAAMSVKVLHAFGASGVFSAPGGTIAIFPRHGPAFLALVTPSCSSITAVLAVLALGLVAPHHDRVRKGTAIAAALSLVVLGNVLRIAASVAVGIVEGRASLVLFHNWVGGLFTFGYILCAYILFLYLLLPRPHRAPRPAHA
jgi:exosortase/archaeosortase family protein